MSKNDPVIWIISGHSEGGKTRFCRQVVEKAKEAGLLVGGVLSPAVFVKGVKTGIQVEDLHSGERQTLANAQDPAADSITPRWKFDPAALAWGAEILKASTPCDLLVVDELGPLELEHNLGWTEGIRAIDARQYQIALVVVRTSLLPIAQKRWPNSQTLTFAYTDTSDRIAREIDRILGG